MLNWHHWLAVFPKSTGFDVVVSLIINTCFTTVKQKNKMEKLWKKFDRQYLNSDSKKTIGVKLQTQTLSFTMHLFC